MEEVEKGRGVEVSWSRDAQDQKFQRQTFSRKEDESLRDLKQSQEIENGGFCGHLVSRDGTAPHCMR